MTYLIAPTPGVPVHVPERRTRTAVAAAPRPIQWPCDCRTRLTDQPPVLRMERVCGHHAPDVAGFLSWVLDATGLRGRVLPETQHPQERTDPLDLTPEERDRRIAQIEARRPLFHGLRTQALYHYRQPRSWTLPAAWDPGHDNGNVRPLDAPIPPARLFGLPVRFAGEGIVRLHLDHTHDGPDSITATVADRETLTPDPPPDREDLRARARRLGPLHP